VADLAEMFQARRELAELELQADVASSKRLAVTAGVGAAIALTSLSLFAGTLAQVLQARWDIGVQAADGTPVVNLWLPILAAGLLLAGTLLGWAGYRRFRRELLGFRQTLAEMREDIQWLREWTESERGEQ
jgi:hypothetical protein